MRVGLQPHLSAPWTPKRLGASLAVWLRGDSKVLNGSNASQATDLSTNARHYTQGAAGAQPAWSATGLAGRPCFTFDGSDDILVGPSLAALSTSADVFVVVQLDVDPPIAGHGGCWDCAGTGQEDYCPNFADGAIYQGALSTARKSTAVTKGSGYFQTPRIVAVYSAASDWKLSLNGVQQYSTGTNTFASSGGVAIGGDATVSAARLKGKIAELIIASPALTSTQRAKVHSYLGKRYGITV